MRVAYLVNQYPSISHTFIRREIAALERRGVTVVRFAIRPSKADFQPPEDAEEELKTRHILRLGARGIFTAAVRSLIARPGRAFAALFEALKIGRCSEAGIARHLAYWAEALVLAAWMRRDGLRHLHAHFGTNSATVAMLAARIAGATFSMTVHGPEEFDKPGLIALAHKIRRAAFVVAVSQYGLSQLRRLTPPQEWPSIHVVRCGVEAAFHAGRAAPVPADAIFVSVGRLSEQKGQLTLVEASGILAREGRRFCVRLVGDGEMRHAIENAIRREGLGGVVEIVGWRTPDQVRDEIERARALVLPSYAEGLPVSIMEAFALSRPVISTFVAGIPELVRPGENGWLAPAGDAAALADAMRAAIAASADEIAAYGRNGKKLTLQRHDVDKEAEKLATLFAEAGA